MSWLIIKYNVFHNGLVPPLNSSCQKPMMENFETKITLVPNRFKLSLLPSYIMLFVSDEVCLFLFQGSFDKGSQHEQLLLLSCTALCILIEIRIIPCVLSTYYNYIGHTIISFMIFLYSVSPFFIPYFITFVICLHIIRIFPSFNIQKSEYHRRLTFY